MFNIKKNLFDGIYPDRHEIKTSFSFITDARDFKIHFKYKNETKGNFSHIGLGSRKGLAILYKPIGSKQWFNYDIFVGQSTFNVSMNNLIHGNDRYEIMICCPILSKIDSLDIELSENDFFKVKEEYDAKLLFVGGVNTFGNGCTASNLMFPNILGRKLNSEVTRIAFNKWNYLEDLYAHLKNGKSNELYDIGILELDYITQSNDVVENYLEKILEILDKKCKYIVAWYSLPHYKRSKKDQIDKIMKKYTNSDYIFLEDLSMLNNEYKDIYTLNDFYLNDSGNVLIYKKLINKIRSVTKWNI